jgi:hypothetical protein
MAFPTTGLLDDFSGTLGNWTTPAFGDAALAISSGQLTSSGTGWGGGFWSAASFGPDMEAWELVPTAGNSGDDFALWVRCTNTGGSPTGYNLAISAVTGAWVLAKYVSGTGTNLATGTQAWSGGDSFGIDVIGTTITAHYKSGAGSWGNLVASTGANPASDSAISGTGRIGAEVFNNVYRLDNFSGGTVVVAGGPTLRELALAGVGV